MARTTNKVLLRKLVHDYGKYAVTNISYGSYVGASTLQKLMANSYPNYVPMKPLRERLAKFLKVDEDELFPKIPD